MNAQKRLISYFFPPIPDSNAAAYAERCADENLKWGQRLSAVLLALCALAGIWVTATMRSSLAGLAAAAGAAVFGVLFAAQTALRAGAVPPFGISRIVAVHALTLTFGAALAVHALAFWANVGAADKAGSLMLATIAANVVLMPTVRRAQSVAAVFMVDAAFAYVAATLPGEAGNAFTRASIVAIACIGIAAACAIHRYRAHEFVQHEALAQKYVLLEGALKKLVDDNVQLESISSTDELTKLHNRRSFATRLDSYWAWSLRSKTSIALILVDIDDFKLFNDNYGHLKGDLCLKRIADCLLASVSREMDFVARIGGEEFMLIVCNVSEDGVRFIAEKVRKNIENASIEHNFSTVTKRVTVSIGCALMVPSHAATAVDLINQADIALYESKRTGKDRYTIYRQDSPPAPSGLVG